MQMSKIRKISFVSFPLVRTLISSISIDLIVNTTRFDLLGFFPRSPRCFGFTRIFSYCLRLSANCLSASVNFLSRGDGVCAQVTNLDLLSWGRIPLQPHNRLFLAGVFSYRLRLSANCLSASVNFRSRGEGDRSHGQVTKFGCPECLGRTPSHDHNIFRF